MTPKKTTEVSVVTAVLNEKGNLEELVRRLTETLKRYQSFEIIAVNDGSTDGSEELLGEIADRNSNLKVINLRRRGGQTAALAAGIDHATKEVVVLIDADLENLPEDIDKLIEKLDEGYDVVSGWRKERWQGQVLTRKLPSMSANTLISKLTKVPLHDYGCTLKAYRAHIIKEVKLYGEMHRFIPAYAAWQGARITEIPVSYQPRSYGTSNYGFTRTYRVLLDLVLLRFFDKYFQRPMHFFGGIGFGVFFLGVLAGIAAIVLKIMQLRDFVSTPLPVFSALLIIVGVVLVAMGVLSEIMIRTYYESQDKKTYPIKSKINL